MPLRVLSWNLMHGRSVPPAGHDIFEQFAEALSGWEWHVAFLQEAPPWWPELLARALRAEHRMVLTSRNSLLPVRRAIAVRWPDLIKSNGGGCNAILVRRGHISEHRSERLCWLPERRFLLAVRLEQGIWLATLHATVHDAAAAVRESRAAAAATLAWATGEPLVLGGDFNVRQLALEGFSYAGGVDVDHVFVSRLEAPGAAHVPDRGRLSDHAPVVVEVSVG